MLAAVSSGGVGVDGDAGTEDHGQGGTWPFWLYARGGGMLSDPEDR